MAGRLDVICSAILCYLHKNPDVSLSLPMPAEDECWGDFDGSTVRLEEFHLACNRLLRSHKVVPAEIADGTEFERKGSGKKLSKGVERLRGAGRGVGSIRAIKLNLNPRGKEQPKPRGRILPEVDPSIVVQKVRPAPKPKPPEPKPEPEQPEPAPAPPSLIDIDKDILRYAQQALAVLRQYGQGRPWQTIGKRDCWRLIRSEMSGLSKTSAGRLVQVLRRCGFVRVTPTDQGGISLVLAEGELTARILRSKGFKLQETAEELRAELTKSYQVNSELEARLNERQRLNDALREELRSLWEEFGKAETVLAEQQQELTVFKELVESLSKAQPQEVTLDPALRDKALEVIRRWK